MMMMMRFYNYLCMFRRNVFSPFLAQCFLFTMFKSSTAQSVSLEWNGNNGVFYHIAFSAEISRTMGFCCCCCCFLWQSCGDFLQDAHSTKRSNYSALLAFEWQVSRKNCKNRRCSCQLGIFATLSCPRQLVVAKQLQMWHSLFFRRDNWNSLCTEHRASISLTKH